MTSMAQHRFEIEPRPTSLGGCWRLRLLEEGPDGAEIEMGGDVFPPEDGITDADAYALATGANWLADFSVAPYRALNSVSCLLLLWTHGEYKNGAV